MSHRQMSVRDRCRRRLRGLAVLTAAAGTALPLLVAAGGSATPVDAVLALARQQVGEAYTWGGTGPDSWDCSGLTSYVWHEAGGVTLPRVSRDQQRWAVPVPREQLLPGDLVFYGEPVDHVALYVGDGRIVDASSAKRGVVERALWSAPVVRYGRVPRPDMPPVTPWTPPAGTRRLPGAGCSRGRRGRRGVGRPRGRRRPDRAGRDGGHRDERRGDPAGPGRRCAEGAGLRGVDGDDRAHRLREADGGVHEAHDGRQADGDRADGRCQAHGHCQAHSHHGRHRRAPGHRQADRHRQADGHRQAHGHRQADSHRQAHGHRQADATASPRPPPSRQPPRSPRPPPGPPPAPSQPRRRPAPPPPSAPCPTSRRRRPARRRPSRSRPSPRSRR